MGKAGKVERECGMGKGNANGGKAGKVEEERGMGKGHERGTGTHEKEHVGRRETTTSLFECIATHAEYSLVAYNKRLPS